MGLCAASDGAANRSTAYSIWSAGSGEADRGETGLRTLPCMRLFSCVFFAFVPRVIRLPERRCAA